METGNEKLRQQFSDRLKRELKRLGLPVGSPTQIAQQFNGRFHGKQVAAQTVRKWMFAEAIPTQAKLQALAEWFEVSPQWLRYGIGPKKTGEDVPTGVLETASGIAVNGTDQEELAYVIELLTNLSPSNVRLAGSIIRCILSEQSSS